MALIQSEFMLFNIAITTYLVLLLLWRNLVPILTIWLPKKIHKLIIIITKSITDLLSVF